MQGDNEVAARWVLKLLVLVTHHGGVEARLQVAQRYPAILRCLQDRFGDPTIAIPAVIVLRFALAPVLAPCSCLSHPSLLSSLRRGIKPILEATVETLRHHRGSLIGFLHGIRLLVSATVHFPEECEANRSLLSLFVAFARSKNVTVRALVVSGLMDIFNPHRKEETPSQDTETPWWPSHRKLFTATTKGTLPTDLQREADAYGVERCESTYLAECYDLFPGYIFECIDESNLCTAGHKLANLLMSCDVKLDGPCVHSDGPVPEGLTGFKIPPGTTIPFKHCSEAFPRCAEALRARGLPEDLDAADYLELRNHVMNRQYNEAFALGERVVQRNPELAYAHYAMSFTANVPRGLRALRRALGCPVAHPSLRLAALVRAVREHTDAGIWVLRELREDHEERWKIGAAYILYARQLAGEYMAEAPPDARYMHHVVSSHVLLTFLAFGPEVTPDFSEFQVRGSPELIVDPPNV